MMVESHILDVSGLCSRCGLRLQGLPLHIGFPFKTGDRFGIITGLKFSPNSAYLVQRPEFDSNALCAPRP
jgi:hypothetical protein